MSALSLLFNGPPIAGIGATTDAGLSRDKYHVIPYGKVTATDGRHISNGVFVAPSATGAEVPTERAVAIGWYNVREIFGSDTWRAHNAGVPPADLDAMERDAVAIVTAGVMGAYYIQECTPNDTEYWGAEATEAETSEIFTVEMMNRAYTFIMARMHTKYQTNHITGGNPMQASMMATYKAFYNVSGNGQANVEQRNKSKAAIEILHWALHPFNEQLLVPIAISGTGLTKFKYFADAPPPEPIRLDEFFSLRRYTPPASTHHFYTAHAAVKLLAPMGVLEFLPDKSRLEHIRSGFNLIRMFGAALHPAAGYWGMEKHSANQKIIEPLAQDLGYAVMNLMPASSLSGSPILRKCDAINTAWKTFIDQIKRVMADSDEVLLSKETVDRVKSSLMLTGSATEQIAEIAMLTIEPAPAPGTSEFVASIHPPDEHLIDMDPQLTFETDPLAPPEAAPSDTTITTATVTQTLPPSQLPVIPTQAAITTPGEAPVGTQQAPGAPNPPSGAQGPSTAPGGAGGSA